MKEKLSLKISISGVRGVIGDSLTPQLAARFALAFGSYRGRGRIIVGQDARASGTMVKNALFSGIIAAGCRPVDAGLCPIPSLLVQTRHSRAIGGIAVTASHNPKEWNGLKFIGDDGLFLDPSQFHEFLDIYHQGDFSFAKAEHYQDIIVEPDPTRIHLQKLLSVLDTESIRKHRFKVAADCSNGAGSVLTGKFLKKLGCRPILINDVPDGTFAHDPEPVPENITRLRRVIRTTGADIGFVQDADADRLAVVDEKGNPIGEELSVVLATRHILQRTPGPVVVNLSTTRAVDDVAAGFGVPVHRTRIGEINVVQEILKRKAVIGGEGNGGVIYPRIHPCRDSFTAMGLILESLAAFAGPVSSLVGTLPRYVLLKDKIPGTATEAHRLIRRLRRKYSGKGEISILDGFKIRMDQAWIHLRPSNTEPVIRLFVEARSRPEAESHLLRFKKACLTSLEEEN